MPALRLLHLNSVRLNRSWVKSTETLRQTQTMLDDAFFNVEDWINSELAVEFSEQEEIAFTSGNGTKKPKRIPGLCLFSG
ncbi:Predicted phage phi-C31 gp36 major capsid-like protein [Klebsiella michiganensis]|uniref:Predicted phage phi-C31 gp36 major capsid-like protein n=1 Tax=Klebsiella michiganensis TaxID=1134687 RepID=A0A7H4MW69_9ENTR|nr:Predicted phage phi-C31 gp36 major capsid-like protein [Klebsiella michiganensis]